MTTGQLTQTQVNQIYTFLENDSSKAAALDAWFSSASDVTPPAVKKELRTLGLTNAGFASGFAGTVSRASTMTVGEAGPETVAVLRNPRAAMLNTGGGGSNVTININGATVRSSDDIDALASAVADKVKKSLAQQGQLLGLRAPSY